VVIVRNASGRVGLLVDELLGERQTVIKPLSALFRNVRGLGGSTILGDGTVALIIDVAGLIGEQRARSLARTA
jgi:two-component system chemotaxis sensor kinase CheA